MERKKEIGLYDYLGEYENSSQEEQMKMLNEFLLLSGEYSKLLAEDVNVERIFRVVADKHKLKYVDKNNVYHYTYDEKVRLCQTEMLPWDREAVDKHIYAIAYAFAKTNQDKDACKIDVIKKKIKEMKRNTMDDLFFEDLIYLIRMQSQLYVKKDEAKEERIKERTTLIPKQIGESVFYVVPTFKHEFDSFIKKVSLEAGVPIDNLEDLPKYRYIVERELEEFQGYLKK